jgi:hypothetical protein
VRTSLLPRPWLNRPKAPLCPGEGSHLPMPETAWENAARAVSAGRAGRTAGRTILDIAPKAVVSSPSDSTGTKMQFYVGLFISHTASRTSEPPLCGNAVRSPRI